MKSPKVIYLIARTHGLRTHLLRKEDYTSILRLRGVTEIAESLLRGDYSEELSRIPIKEVDEAQLERILLEKLSKRFYFLVSVATGNVRTVLEEYAKRFEVENIKRVIRAIHGGEKLTVEDLIPIPRRYLLINFPALVRAESVDEVVGLLRETIYAGLSDYLPYYQEYKSTLILENQLEKIYFSRLWPLLEKIPSKDDVGELIGLEIDLKNIYNITSLKLMEVRPDFLEKAIIPITYRIPRGVLREAVHASLESFLEALTPYRELIERIRPTVSAKSYAEMERLIQHELYRRAEEAMLRKPFSLSYVFSYLLLCEREVRNLVSIMTGKRLGLSEQKIRSFLQV